MSKIEIVDESTMYREVEGAVVLRTADARPELHLERYAFEVPCSTCGASCWCAPSTTRFFPSIKFMCLQCARARHGVGRVNASVAVTAILMQEAHNARACIPGICVEPSCRNAPRMLQ